MQILTIAEVAEKLRLPQPSVYKLIHDKRRPLPACKCGKQYRVREADLWQWFAGADPIVTPKNDNSGNCGVQTIKRTKRKAAFSG